MKMFYILQLKDIEWLVRLREIKPNSMPLTRNSLHFQGHAYTENEEVE
jgi:hypothetical protein